MSTEQENKSDQKEPKTPVRDVYEDQTPVDGKIESAKLGLAKAVEAFRHSLASKVGEKPLSESSFMNQHLKGVLDNMENGRKAVQEKVKFVIPTVLTTFAATWSATYVALDKTENPWISIALLVLASGISYFGTFACRALNRVMIATYDFYVASIIHARVVFHSVNLHHHWATYVNRAIEQLESEKLRNLDANEIRTEFQKTQSLFVRALHKGQAPIPFGEQERYSWSARVLEQWKTRPGTLLDSYERLMGLSYCLHCVLIFILLTLALLKFVRHVPWKEVVNAVFGNGC